MFGVPRPLARRAGQRSIVIERTYQAPVHDLWALWTTKNGFEAWWGPEGYRVDVQVIEARLGGALDYAMVPVQPVAPEGRECGPSPLISRLRFTEFEPYRRLVLTHLMDFIIETDPYNHDIEVDFIATVGATTMSVTVYPHKDADRTATAVSVFLEQIEKLGRLLAGRT